MPPAEEYEHAADDDDFDPVERMNARAAAQAEKPKSKGEQRKEEKFARDLAKQADKPDPEEVLAHQYLCSHLRRYFEHPQFVDELRTAGLRMTSTEMKKATIAELEEQLVRIKVTLNNSGTSELISQGANLGVQIVEYGVSSNPIAKRYKVNVSGAAAILKQNAEFHRSLAQMDLEYDIGGRYMTPAVRSGCFVLGAMFQAYTVNSAAAMLASKVAAAVQAAQAAAAPPEAPVAAPAFPEDPAAAFAGSIFDGEPAPQVRQEIPAAASS